MRSVMARSGFVLCAVCLCVCMFVCSMFVCAFKTVCVCDYASPEVELFPEFLPVRTSQRLQAAESTRRRCHMLHSTVKSNYNPKSHDCHMVIA